MKPKKSQHVQAAVIIGVYVFLANYVTTPTAMSFLHSHAWLADLVGASLASYHTMQAYSVDSTHSASTIKPDVDGG